MMMENAKKEGRNDEVEVVGVEMGDADRGDNDEGGRVEGNHEDEMRYSINDSNNGDGQEDSDEGRDDGVGVVGVKMREDCDDGDSLDEAQEDDEGRDAKEVQEEGGDVVKDDSQDGVGLSLES